MRPATRERGNGRMALTVLKPTLETLGEDEAEAGNSNADLERERSRRGRESPMPSGGEGKGKKSPVPLKVRSSVLPMRQHIISLRGQSVGLV